MDDEAGAGDGGFHFVGARVVDDLDRGGGIEGERPDRVGGPRGADEGAHGVVAGRGEIAQQGAAELAVCAGDDDGVGGGGHARTITRADVASQEFSVEAESIGLASRRAFHSPGSRDRACPPLRRLARALSDAMIRAHAVGRRTSARIDLARNGSVWTGECRAANAERDLRGAAGWRCRLHRTDGCSSARRLTRPNSLPPEPTTSCEPSHAAAGMDCSRSERASFPRCCRRRSGGGVKSPGA